MCNHKQDIIINIISNDCLCLLHYLISSQKQYIASL